MVSTNRKPKQKTEKKKNLGFNWPNGKFIISSILLLKVDDARLSLWNLCISGKIQLLRWHSHFPLLKYWVTQMNVDGLWKPSRLGKILLPRKIFPAFFLCVSSNSSPLHLHLHLHLLLLQSIDITEILQDMELTPPPSFDGIFNFIHSEFLRVTLAELLEGFRCPFCPFCYFHYFCIFYINFFLFFFAQRWEWITFSLPTSGDRMAKKIRSTLRQTTKKNRKERKKNNNNK